MTPRPRDEPAVPSRIGLFASEAVIRGDSKLKLLQLDLDNLEGLVAKTLRQMAEGIHMLY